MNPSRVLFLGKRDDEFCQSALQFCRQNFKDVSAFLGAWGEQLPQASLDWSGDYIISYLSRWVVPKALLDRARIAAINFHPATPDYPGIGCINFALYDGVKEYGATCHHMWPKVDTGPIVAVRRIAAFEDDTVETLLGRTYDTQLDLFFEVGWLLAQGNALPISAERWTRQPYSRREFDSLNQISDDMPNGEKQRRIRACAYRQYFPKRVELVV